MNDALRRRMDKIDRERVFLTDNAADFPVGSPTETISATIDGKAAQVLASDAELVSSIGDKSQAMANKEDARDNLLEEFRDVIMGAVAIGNADEPGITAKFKMPEPRTEQNLIATADAFFADTAPPLEAKFLAVGLPFAFRAEITNAKTSFQQARDEADSALEEHGEAVGTLDALVREMMAL